MRLIQYLFWWFLFDNLIDLFDIFYAHYSWTLQFWFPQRTFPHRFLIYIYFFSWGAEHFKILENHWLSICPGCFPAYSQRLRDGLKYPRDLRTIELENEWMDGLKHVHYCSSGSLESGHHRYGSVYLNCGRIKGECVTHLTSVGRSGLHRWYKRETLQMHSPLSDLDSVFQLKP